MGEISRKAVAISCGSYHYHILFSYVIVLFFFLFFFTRHSSFVCFVGRIHRDSVRPVEAVFLFFPCNFLFLSRRIDDQTLWCFGNNENGQLGCGDGEKRDSLSPCAPFLDVDGAPFSDVSSPRISCLFSGAFQSVSAPVESFSYSSFNVATVENLFVCFLFCLHPRVFFFFFLSCDSLQSMSMVLCMDVAKAILDRVDIVEIWETDALKTLNRFSEYLSPQIVISVLVMA